MFNSMLRRQNGFTTTTFVLMTVGIILLFVSMSMIDTSRRVVLNVIKAETQRKIVGKVRNYLKSQLVVQFSLDKFNSPAQNPVLKDCLMAGVPSTASACADLPIEFYQPIDATHSEKFSGGASSPAYADSRGNFCDPSGMVQNTCTFKVVSKCSFECPGSQTECAMVKLMNCDLEITNLEVNSILRSFIHSKVENRVASSFSIRINSDLKSYSLSR